jgi:hypothetical protein
MICLPTWFKTAISVIQDKFSNVRCQTSIEEQLQSLQMVLDIIFTYIGNSEFFFSGFMSEPNDSNKNKDLLEAVNTRTFDYLAALTKPKVVKELCEREYELGTSGYDSCLRPQNFCRIKCDNVVDPFIESLYNFKCLKTCLKITKPENKLGTPITTVVPWKPSKDILVDFVLRQGGEPLRGKIKDITGDNNVTIEYSDETGPQSTVFAYTNDNIFKCGEKKSGGCV